MKRKRFTPVTGIIIVVLFGVLYGVGHVVTPAPVAPKAEQKQSAAVTPPPGRGEPKKGAMSETQMKEKMQSEMQMAQRQAIKHELEVKANGGKPLPSEDAISSDYFHHHEMGIQGLKAADQEAQRRQQIDDQVQKEMAARGLNGPVPGASSAGPAPSSSPK